MGEIEDKLGFISVNSNHFSQIIANFLNFELRHTYYLLPITYYLTSERSLLIRRNIFGVLANRIQSGCCPDCGCAIAGIGMSEKSALPEFPW